MRTRLAFAACLAGTFVLGAAAFAQAMPAAPDLIVSIRKAPIGADMVNVSARKADFPPELLKQGLAALGERLGHPARGVEAHRESFRPGDLTATFVKGSCAVDGLIGNDGDLAVAPLAQAFAGLPAPHTVHRMLMSFDGVMINPGRTVAYHTAGPGSDLVFAGRAVGSSVEYEVELRSQDPARLVVSGAAVAPTAKPVPATRGPDPLVLVAICASVLAAGALVYCLILLLGRRSVSRP